MTTSVAIKSSDLDVIRADCLADPFLFAKVVCGHKDLTTTMHRPLMYMAAGCTDKLIDILNDPKQDSYTIREIRYVLQHRQGIKDWNTPEGREQLDRQLRFLNIRLFRGGAKSSSLTHSIALWKATNDPNLSIVIVTNVEKKATAFCKQIRDTVQSDLYRALFPDRYPDNPNRDLTEDSLTLKGRNRPDKEATIMAFSAGAKNMVGYHWDCFIIDDLVGKEDSSPVGLQVARDFLAGLVAFRNPGKRYPITRLHVGTRYADDDDDAVLRGIPACFSISIPIEWYPPDNRKPDDVSLRGLPIEPSWQNAEAISDIFKEVEGEEGASSWRENYWLDPFAGDARIFPTEVVNKTAWDRVPVRDPRRKKDWILVRPSFDPETKAWKVDERGQQLYSPVAEVRYDGSRAHVKGLNLFFGVDQAFAESGGDQWSICCLGIDKDGFLYVLDLEYGTGYESMLDNLLYMDEIWRPQLIGIEGGGGGQSSTHFWLESSDKYRKLRGRIEKVPTHGASKREKIINMVAEPLKMKKLYLLPSDEPCRAQMIKYRGAKTTHEADDIIDSIRIAAELIRKPAAKEETKKRVRDMMRSRQRRVDRRTGILL